MDHSRRLILADFDPMRTKSDDQAVKDGYVWLPEKAERVTRFLEKYCRLYFDRWRGKPIELMPYQQDFLWRLYGWVHKDTGLRRFTEAYWEVAKKNGKSPVVGGLGVYHLVADGVAAPEVHLNATSRYQAGIVYKSASKMIAQEPRFRGMLFETPSEFRIEYPAKDGYLIANSSEAGSKDGFQPSFTIFDELHRQVGRDLWDVYQHAGVSRLEPLILSITTAGLPDDEHPCYIEHKRALAVENGSRIDVRFLGEVYGPREHKPDVDDPKVWRMANPAMGYIFNEANFAASLQKAKESGPAALATFKRLRLNIWSKEIAKWLDMQVWHAQASSRTDEEIEASGDVWAAGVDMSANTDLTCYVRVSGTIRNGVDVRCHFWIPEETAIERQQKEKIPYLEYAERGWVTLIPGPCIDPSWIRDYVLEDAAKLKGRLKRIHSDYYNAGELGNALTAKGLDFKWFVQGPLSFHRPLKTIENLVLRRVLRHGGHPLLDYCAGNSVCDDNNKNQNKMLVKHKSTGRIDGMVALAEALAGLMDLLGYDGDGGELGVKPKIKVAPKIFWS